MSDLFFQLFILLLVFIGIAFGIFVIWYSISSDGWRFLVPHYRTASVPSGKVWRYQSGFVGGGNYRNILNLTANAEGLFLALSWFSLVGHPTIFIPWHDLHNATLQTDIFWRNVKVDVGNPPLTTLRLPAAVFEQSEGRMLLENSNRESSIKT